MSLYSFPSRERLKSKTQISQLFLHGTAVKKYPILIKFQFSDLSDSSDSIIQSLFSVPKRKFRKAVDRNLIRRRMKESYRLRNAEYLSSLKIPHEKQLSLAFIYTGNDIIDYSIIDKAMRKSFEKLIQAVDVL